MSANSPQSLEGTQGGAPLELLWDKHRAKFNALVWV